LDKKYPIEWERYRNCALLKNKEGFRVVKIFLVKVHTFWYLLHILMDNTIWEKILHKF
jgi:hypothetical protein